MGLVSASAHAASGPPDPGAPPGASGQWLPRKEWVMQRWVPFDEALLYELLGTPRPGVERWLADSRGRRTLVDLARQRGIGRVELLRLLVAPQRKRVTRAQYKLLRSRTNRMLTQSHLAQHMLFHTFHMWSVRDAARRTLGLTESEWKSLRDRPAGEGPGVTVAEIARRRGIPIERLRAPALRAIVGSNRRGVRAGAMSRAQAAGQLAEQRWKIAFWPREESGPMPAARTAHLFCEL